MTSVSDTQRRLADASRRRILDAARDVFRAQGFAAAKTLDIAKAAGVKESRLWTLFQTKEELFALAVLDVLESAIADMLGHADLRLAETSDSREVAFAKAQERWLGVLNEIMPLLGMAMFSNPATGAVFYRDRLIPLFERALTSSRVGLQSWSPLAEDERTSFMFLWGAHFGVALDGYLSESEMDVPAVAQKLADLLYHGAVEQGTAHHQTDTPPTREAATAGS